MHATFTPGRISGIEISLHWSWLVVFALIVWTLADAVFPAQNPGLSKGTYLGMAVVGASAFFASVLLHELGHAFQARREGLTIDGITLWLFGGVARFGGRFPSAPAELRIALAGPAVTAVLTIGLGLVAALPSPTAVDGVAAWLAYINLLLLGFNMLPAVPLDGGRVLHAMLWRAHGDLRRATIVASGIGRGFGYVMIGSGMALVFAGGAASGVWFLFLGWFLLLAATAEGREVQLRDALGDLRVEDLMVHHPVVAAADQTLASFIDDVAHVHRYTTYPVLEHGIAVGLLPFSRVVATPRRRWDEERVRDCMLPRDAASALTADMPLMDALGVMQEHRVDRALVLDGDALAGLLSITDVGRVVSEATAARSTRA